MKLTSCLIKQQINLRCDYILTFPSILIILVITTCWMTLQVPGEGRTTFQEMTTLQPRKNTDTVDVGSKRKWDTTTAVDEHVKACEGMESKQKVEASITAAVEAASRIKEM